MPLSLPEFLTPWFLWLPDFYTCDKNVRASSSGHGDRVLSIRDQTVTYFRLCTSHGLSLSEAESNHKQHVMESLCLYANTMAVMGRGLYLVRGLPATEEERSQTGDYTWPLWYLLFVSMRYLNDTHSGTETNEAHRGQSKRFVEKMKWESSLKMGSAGYLWSVKNRVCPQNGMGRESLESLFFLIKWWVTYMSGFCIL